MSRLQCIIVPTPKLIALPCCRFRFVLLPLVGVILPAALPCYYWGEGVIHAFAICSFLRYVLTLHAVWCVNSAAHMWGMRPYDKHIDPTENMFVSVVVLGDGYHNYHHTFPQDYSTSEYGWRINFTTMFIDFCAAIGLVTHRKKMSRDLIQRRRARTGDGGAVDVKADDG